MRAALRVKLAHEFQQMAAKVTAAVSHFHKAAAPKPDWNLDEVMRAALGSLDWQPIAAEVGPVLVEAALAGVSQALRDLQITDSAVIVQSQDLARAWAKERAAEMVGMKVVNGVLVDNPRAEWNIAETTREEIRQAVEQAFAAETRLADLAAAIQDSGAFSDYRAEMIAETEVTRAQSAGILKAWKQTGVVQTVRWLVSSLGCCDVCEENAAAGAIPLGDDFPSGDPCPPAHPRCRCALVSGRIQ